MKKNIVG